MSDDRAALDGFTGVARLFPLPNLVLFPGVDQGLHIFESRYRQMTADALTSDQLIAMVLLKPDWEDGYDGRPAIEPVACLGRITRSERLSDGRYNLRLRGLARLRLDDEIPDDDKLYRLARGVIVPDVPPGDLAEASSLRQELRAVVLARFDPAGTVYDRLVALFESDLPLGAVCDLLGYSLPLRLEVKQLLLGEPAVAARVRVLGQALRLSAGDRTFPPGFSAN